MTNVTLTSEQAQQLEEALMKIADLRNLGKIQPEVIAFETLYIIRAAMAQEQAEQEPVAVISESAIGLVKLHSNGVSLPFGTPLYAASVDAKAIRAEALEEAAKWCEQGTGDAVQTETLKLLLQERGRIASVIRGLK